ncbi:MAG: DUF2268 domain-containing putative Zn-dependent protease [Anaerobacillus sp.]
MEEDELESMLFFGMIHPESDPDLLTSKLTKVKDLNCEMVIQSELSRLQLKYQSDHLIFFELFILSDNDHFVKEKLGGVSAFTEWNGKMCFIVNPSEDITPVLRSVIAHEFHHHMRIQRLKMKEENETLLDRLILEGLAEHFVMCELGEEYLGPYKDALNETEAKYYWNNRFKQHMFVKGIAAEPFMFGSNEKALPFWGGYAIGFFLVKQYITKHPELTIQQLTGLPSIQYV